MLNSTNKPAENYIKTLEQDLEAASKQLSYSSNQVDRLRIKRQIEVLTNEINQLKQPPQPIPVITVNDLIKKEAFDLKNIIAVCRTILLQSPLPKVHTFILGCDKDHFLDAFFERLKKDCAFLEAERIRKISLKIGDKFPPTLNRVVKYKSLLDNEHVCLFIRVEEYNDTQEILRFINSINEEFNSHSGKTLIIIICSNSLCQINSSIDDITILPSLPFCKNDMIDWINEIVDYRNWQSIMRSWVTHSFQYCCPNDKTDFLDTSLVYDYIGNINEIFRLDNPSSAEEFFDCLEKKL